MERSVFAVLVLLGLVLLFGTSSVDAYATLRRLRVAGDISAYDLGFVQGQSFGSDIVEFLAADAFLNNDLRPFTAAGTGKLALEFLLEANQGVLPSVYDELRGIATGANVSFADLLMLSFQQELYAVMQANISESELMKLREQEVAFKVAQDAILQSRLSRVETPEHALEGVDLLDEKDALSARVDDMDADDSGDSGDDDVDDDDDDVELANEKIGTNDAIPDFLKDCSDILLSGFIGHNEDTRAVVMETAYLLETDEFTAYVYPGFVAGNAWAFNRYGLVMTSDAVFPKAVFARGAARYWVQRDLLSSKSFADVSNKASGLAYGIKPALGFAYNVGFVRQLQTINLEVIPMEHALTVTKCTGDAVFHFNMYLYNKEIAQYDDPSSIHRLARALQFSPPKTEYDMLNILSDTQDSEYPIFRSSKTPDTVSTVCTVVFDLQQAKARIWVGNPLKTPVLLTLSLSFTT
eukprot:ANDGO_03900.mRNA.1 hypothetical protein NAEGRDRAFT_82752